MKRSWRSAFIILSLPGLVACEDEAKKGDVGDRCSNNTDCADAICHSGICVSRNPLKNGEACDSAGWCKSLLCASGRCAQNTKPPGAPCLNLEECASVRCTAGLCFGPDPADGGPEADAASPDAMPSDAMPSDAMPSDAAPLDALSADTALPDTSPPDAWSAVFAGKCFFDANFPGPKPVGSVVQWSPMPIKYTINPAGIPTGLQKADVMNAIHAAFKTWEKLGCTDISFSYVGESTSYTWISDRVLVYFGHDSASWPQGPTIAYTRDVKWKATGAMDYASMGMNVKDYQWIIGKQASKIDIQTAITLLLAEVLGFYVGPDVKARTVLINYDQVSHTLSKDHWLAAQFTYFKAGTGCMKPSTVPPCTVYVTP